MMPRAVATTMMMMTRINHCVCNNNVMMMTCINPLCTAMTSINEPSKGNDNHEEQMQDHARGRRSNWHSLGEGYLIL
jgi:hypothetical protein